MPSFRRGAGLAVLVALLAIRAVASASAQTPRLVKDLNTANAGSDASPVAVADGWAYVVAFEPDHGVELWRTNGRRTVLVKDIWPGPGPSFPRGVTVAGDRVFFVAISPSHGAELWVTDGSKAGTRMIVDLTPGPAGSSFHSLVAAGDRVFFFLADYLSRYELWTSDGSESGTRRIWAYDRPGDDYLLSPSDETAVGDRLFFVFDDLVHGSELWTSDGTAAGTGMVRDISPSPYYSNPRELVGIGDTLFFAAEDEEHGVELWRSDGTEEGTVLVADIEPGSASSDPIDLYAFGDDLLFSAHRAETGHELFRSDGTAQGTQLIQDLWPGAVGSRPDFFGAAGELVYFFAAPEQPEIYDSDLDLWVTDGTTQGTRSVHPIGPTDYASSFGVAIGDTLVFSVDAEGLGRELWRSDGTSAGTEPLRDIAPGPDASWPRGLLRLGDRILFSAEEETFGRELWMTDGTETGTVLLHDLNWKGTLSGPSSGLVALDGVLYFAGSDAVHGTEVWRSDGTAAGTYMVHDVRAPGSSIVTNDFAVAGGRLYFLADDGIHGRELWTSDGTATGTRLVVDLAPGPESPRFLSWPYGALLGAGDYVYLITADWDAGEIVAWRSDGTAAGTLPVWEGAGWMLLGAAVGELAFLADHKGLVRSDGTREGTFRVARVNLVGGFKVFPGEFFPFGDVLLFTPDQSAAERELWRSDGTRRGTHVVADIAPGPESSDPYGMAEAGGLVYFVADDRTHGRELWRTDGSSSGTRLVADITPGAEGSYLGTIGGAGGALFFSGPVKRTEDPSDSGLWRSRGSPGTTRLLTSEVTPGIRFGRESQLAFGDHLYFASGDAWPRRFGEELWRTDGTRKGTQLVADLVPGPHESNPRGLTAAGESLFFVAGSGRYGGELWVIGPGRDSDAGGRVIAIPDQDGSGGGELAAVLPTLTVRDAASGAEILRTAAGPGEGWETVDVEALGDLDGNGSAELAVLARRRQRTRIFVRDALTGELLRTLRLRRRHAPLDLETVPGGATGADRLAVLGRRGAAGRPWLVVRDPSGDFELTRPLPANLAAIDLEVETRQGEGAGLVVLGQARGGRKVRLVTVDPDDGTVRLDRSIGDELLPLDLEIAHSGGGGQVAALLVEEKKSGAGRILTLDLATGETRRVIKLGKDHRSLDLESVPGGGTAGGPGLLLLEAERDGLGIRVTTLDVRTGRSRARVDFPGLLTPFDLAVLDDLDGSGSPEAALLAEDECAGGALAMVIRDAAAGDLIACHPEPRAGGP